MKKVAIIEDRYRRQEQFLEKNCINLDDYSDILENFIEEKSLNLVEKIVNNIYSDLKDFEIIICHKSIYFDNKNTEIIDNLKAFCKKNHKTLVLFSGGISTNYYDNSEFEFLELNSKTIYSKNLIIFLEAIKAKNENIMMLCYGEHWRENIVANVLEKINLFIFDVQSGIENVSNFQIDTNLTKTEHKFYKPKENTLEEIVKFKESLEQYFRLSLDVNDTTQSVIIHHDNVCDPQIFNYPIKFIQSSEEIDTYISDDIINKELSLKEFDTIFIKDNLSLNYLELYGLRVAYHIRLSDKLGGKRFAPIVIISDFDTDALNKFAKESNLLFTEGIYLCKNTKEEIQKYQSLALQGLRNYDEFLSRIEVSAPKDTSGTHDIANIWSIYRWAKLLTVENSDAIDKNKKEVENQLYFKYIKALHVKQSNEAKQIVTPSKNGKVLLIDDEWNKGWADILKSALNFEGLEFDVFEYDFKDKTNFNLIVQLEHKELKKQITRADVVVLDLRLLESDHDNIDLENYSGIKLLQKIHDINKGIQVIMLTATSKSTILEKLYEKKILGYIKKEHPDDKNIDTVENINKFVKLVDTGLNRKYLKEIYNNKLKILNILKDDIFAQYGVDFNQYELYWNKIIVETEAVFDILDSDKGNRFLYATVSIAVSIESILSIFIPNNRKMSFWDGEAYECNYNALRCRINELFKKLGSNKNFDMSIMIEKRNDYIHKKSVVVNQDEIKTWFNELRIMIETIQNPPNLRAYNKGDLNSLINKYNS